MVVYRWKYKMNFFVNVIVTCKCKKKETKKGSSRVQRTFMSCGQLFLMLAYEPLSHSLILSIV